VRHLDEAEKSFATVAQASLSVFRPEDFNVDEEELLRSAAPLKRAFTADTTSGTRFRTISPQARIQQVRHAPRPERKAQSPVQQQSDSFLSLEPERNLTPTSHANSRTTSPVLMARPQHLTKRQTRLGLTPPIDDTNEVELDIWRPDSSFCVEEGLSDTLGSMTPILKSYSRGDPADAVAVLTARCRALEARVSYQVHI